MKKNLVLLKRTYFVIISLFISSLPLRAETLAEKIAQAEASIQALSKQQAETQTKLQQIEKDYKEELEESRKNNPKYKYDNKVKEIQKAKNSKQSVKTEQETTVKEKKQEQNQEMDVQKKTRKPIYQPKTIKGQGRRPFKKSSLLEGAETYASIEGSETFSFADELETPTIKVYSGTTEENIFVFSDNLANFCQIDTNSVDKMPECLEKIIAVQGSGVQTAKDKMQILFEESLQDMTVNNVAESARIKNDAAGFEADVLIPLQQKSSNSSDERSDIEVLTFSEMEGLKLKNNIIMTYSNILARDSFVDFGNYEISEMGVTNIDQVSQ